ncbi:MAG: electron transfer flavoprotein-ubiquinone oxidoreductase [Arenicellaceae bacterium]|nr:electron transfer flavoprotein-ubiquinone oxidoreductase [Arenicellaceae bacterium]
MERESMDYDVVVVGAGPAGLSAAISLRQLAKEKEIEITVCVLEKGSEIGAHIVSGAVFETRALDELEPDWKQKGAPLNTPVTRDEMHVYTSDKGGIKIPNLFVPKPMHNSGNYIVSLSNICRWLGEQAEALGVDIFPGFAAADVLYHEEGSVKGVTTGDMGRAVDGSEKAGFEPGMELHAKYTLFAEGCRGHLGKQLIEKFSLDAVSDTQHYGLGLKELWDIDPQKYEPGLVVHAAGWPLSESGSSGGAFLYHTEDNQVAVGLIVDLNYTNPNLSPYDEFQRLKHHPRIAKYLEGGKRVSYGARAITKGGLNSLPKMSMPGALLIGCDAGTLNFAKIKGSHTAMKSGMIAAETIVSAFESGDEGGSELVAYVENFKDSWVFEELHTSRNFGSALHKWGVWIGGAWNFIEHNIMAAKLPITLRDRKPDHKQIAAASESKPIGYPAPDGKLSFDKLSSVFLSNTNHEEDQPCHLILKDDAVPITTNLALYDAPEQRYCPVGVYEIVEQKGEPKLQINAQNCVHCKTCDIKDPTQNIVWVVPEGTGGPNYPNM